MFNEDAIYRAPCVTEQSELAHVNYPVMTADSIAPGVFGGMKNGIGATYERVERIVIFSDICRYTYADGDTQDRQLVFFPIDTFDRRYR